MFQFVLCKLNVHYNVVKLLGANEIIIFNSVLFYSVSVFVAINLISAKDL